MHSVDSEKDISNEDEDKKASQDILQGLLQVEETVSSPTHSLISLKLFEQSNDETVSDVKDSSSTAYIFDGADDVPQVETKADETGQTNQEVGFSSTGFKTEEEGNNYADLEPSPQVVEKDTITWSNSSDDKLSNYSLDDEDLETTAVYFFFPRTPSNTSLYGAFDSAVRLQQERPIFTSIQNSKTVCWDEKKETVTGSCSTKECNEGSCSPLKTLSYFSNGYTLPPDHFEPLFHSYVRDVVWSRSTESSTSPPLLNSTEVDSKENSSGIMSHEEDDEFDYLAKSGLFENDQNTVSAWLQPMDAINQDRAQPSLDKEVLAQTVNTNELCEGATLNLYLPQRDIIKDYSDAQSLHKQPKPKKIRHNKWKRKTQFADKGHFENIAGLCLGPVMSNMFKNLSAAPNRNLLQTKQNSKHGFFIKKPLKNSWSTGNFSEQASPLPNLYQSDFKRLKLCSNQIFDPTQRWFSLSPTLVSPSTHSSVNSKQKNVKNNMLMTKGYRGYYQNKSLHDLRRFVQSPVDIDTPSTISRIPPLAKVFSVEELEKQMISECAA